MKKYSTKTCYSSVNMEICCNCIFVEDSQKTTRIQILFDSPILFPNEFKLKQWFSSPKEASQSSWGENDELKYYC